MSLTPLEVMARLARTWSPDAMGDPEVARRWVELFDEDVVLDEPASLPHGGEHHGIAGFQAAQAGMGELWEQRIEEAEYWQCAPDRVVLRIVIHWRARAGGRSVLLPMIDLIQIRDGRIVRVEVFLRDTKALLDTLRPDPGEVGSGVNSGP
jgi:ketosteroid isomerase-like protein